MILGVLGSALQIAYEPKDHPLVAAGAKWLVWIGVVLLLWWGFGWSRDWWCHRKPQAVAPPVIGNISSTLPAFVSTGTLEVADVPPWRATASTAGGDALPSMEGLLIALRHTEAMPEGTYLCDIIVAGKRARARKVARPGTTWLSAIYPSEFTEGDVVPLPLHPGTHLAAWREVKGATTDFLVGLKIDVPSSGHLRDDQTFTDPMKG